MKIIKRFALICLINFTSHAQPIIVRDHKPIAENIQVSIVNCVIEGKNISGTGQIINNSIETIKVFGDIHKISLKSKDGKTVESLFNITDVIDRICAPILINPGMSGTFRFEGTAKDDILDNYIELNIGGGWIKFSDLEPKINSQPSKPLDQVPTKE